MPEPGWSGHPNGRLPASVLGAVQHALPAGRHRLRPPAAASLDRLMLAAGGDGFDRRITDSYRTFDVQVTLRRQWCARGRCGMAAKPGTSNHGEAEAIDNGYGFGLRSFGRWMHANEALCRAHGWVWPAWARTKRQFEPWHWEYHRGLDPQAGAASTGAAAAAGAATLATGGLAMAAREDDMIRRGDSGPQVSHLQRLVNGVNARSARLGDFPSLGSVPASGRYDRRTEELLAHALGRAKRYTGIDLDVRDLGLVTPAMIAVLATCAADLHRRLEQHV